MLSTTVKDWLAANAGSGYCFRQSLVTYKDPDGITRTGGTGDVLNAFVVANMIGKSYVTIIAGKTYASLKALNGNQDIGIGDVTWVYENDGSGTAAKYCTGDTTPPTPPPDEPTPPPSEGTGTIRCVSNPTAAEVWLDDVNTGKITIDNVEYLYNIPVGVHTVTFKKVIDGVQNSCTKSVNVPKDATTFAGCVLLVSVTPTPEPEVTPTPPPTGKVGTFVFEGPITGDPTVTLDLSELKMRQAYDGHFEMNDIKITNTSQHPVYIAMRIKLFAGDISVCRQTGYVFDGMDRTDTVNRSLRVKTLEVGETETYDADFFQPTHILGMHTICMLIHGAWTRADVIDEIEQVVG